jgi:drug/metabolite transporter (DMT)-like permease
MTPRGWFLFGAVSVVWGVPYFFIKVAVDAEVPPAFVAWSRIAVGAALLVPLALRRNLLPELRHHERPIVAYAACEIAVPFTLIAIGEQHVSSSLTAILIASVPLVMALLAARFSPGDRPAGLRLVGLFIGLTGVVALMGVDVAGNPDELLGATLILIAAAGYATAPLIVRHRLAALDPLGPVSISLALAAVALLPAALVAPPSEIPPSDALASIGILGIVCTALGLVLFFQLIAEAGPSRATVITYMNPLVAVVLGVVLLDEHVGATSIVGLVLILCGSWLATRGRLPGAGRAERARASRGQMEGDR